MKTRDLISKLQEVDPSGELQVMADGRGNCIVDVAAEPGYWDGPCYYLEGEINKQGTRMHIDSGGTKIVIGTIELEDFIDNKTTLDDFVLWVSDTDKYSDLIRDYISQAKLRHQATIIDFKRLILEKIEKDWSIFHDMDEESHMKNASFYRNSLGLTERLCQGETIALIDSGDFEFNPETREWKLKGDEK